MSVKRKFKRKFGRVDIIFISSSDVLHVQHHHDIAEIRLILALNTHQSINMYNTRHLFLKKQDYPTHISVYLLK